MDNAPSKSAVYLTDTPRPTYSMDHGRSLADARLQDQEAVYQASKASLNAWRDSGASPPAATEAEAYDRSVANLNGWRDASTIATLRHARYGE